MKRIVFPTLPSCTPLPFYLAAEEWVAMNLGAGEYFFAWQVEPTVICGRHQYIPSEVNLGYARDKGIKVVRRKSGGGSVYADRSNVMFSYITPSDGVQATFGKYTAMICRMLGSLGINAEATGRNDIAVGGKKVAGNAFLKLPGRSIVHGTMLYDADFATMAQVLTPSRAKRMAKGVVSVPSRVTTLVNEGIGVTCAEFMEKAMDYLCAEGEYVMQENDLNEVGDIMKTYFDPDFLKTDLEKLLAEPVYIEGVGEIAIGFVTDGENKISDISLHGDFFHLQNFQEHLAKALKGLPFEREAVRKAIENLPLDEMVVGLDREKLNKLLPNS